jgi:serine/threonine-protein kinase
MRSTLTEPPTIPRIPSVPDSSPSVDADLRALLVRALDGQYELDRELGRGGMGIVYLARDVKLKRQVAIKLLPPELAFRLEIRSRFLREAETAAQLQHPNIVPIYAVDEREGLVFFVMQFVEGENLAKRLHGAGPASPIEARRVLREVADALAYAHARGVIHRDIKPDNVLLTPEGRAMVTDFGIARAISDGAETRLTATGVAIGTPAYMSPEQCAGDREVDGRSDLYALGVLGYQMLAGRLPFEANTTPALLVKHLSERPLPIEQVRADLPPDLARAIMICLEKDPANRFPSAEALATALDTGQVPAWTGQQAVPAATAGRPARDGMLPPPPAWTQPSPDWGNVPARAEPGVPAPAAGAAWPSPPTDGATAEEIQRWYAPPVDAFRKKLAPFLSVAAVTVFLDIVGGPNLTFIPAFWSIGIALNYAKLWSDGYDWRDVMREPRDRLLSDVVVGWADSVTALVDPAKRDRLREQRRRERQLARPSGAAALPAGALPADAALGALTGERAQAVRQAVADRDEILRLVEGLSREAKAAVGDVPATARQLADRVQSLAVALEDLERNHAPDAVGALDAEIARLEAQANPLEEGSEERVRRLAYLRRQRRGVQDVAARRAQAAERLEGCRVALQNMRFDLLRLRTGTQSPDSITHIAEEAMTLARDVDGLLAAVERDVGPATGMIGGGRERRSC